MFISITRYKIYCAILFGCIVFNFGSYTFINWVWHSILCGWWCLLELLVRLWMLFNTL